MLIDKKIDCPTVRMIFAVIRFESKSLTLLDPPANKLPPKYRKKVIYISNWGEKNYYNEIICLPVMIIAFAPISRLCMTAIGRRLGPKRAKDSKNRRIMGVPGGKCGSSHESCEARLMLCHEIRNRYVLRTSVKYPSAVMPKKNVSQFPEKQMIKI